MLYDPSTQYWKSEEPEKSTLQLPTSSKLQYSIDEFLKSLQVSEAEIRKIEKIPLGRENHLSGIMYTDTE